MIKVIITGGTIDKSYNETNGQLTFSESVIPKLLKIARCTAPVVFEQLMLLDSLDMTDTDRQRIKAACIATAENKIIITHGTDTMVQTAKYIDSGSDLANKTIVITGAMIPYRFGHSDALFNLGTALCGVQNKPPGTYIAMNGSVHPCGHVQKNKQQGIFQTI